MRIALCDDQKQDLRRTEELLQLWQEQRKHPLHWQAYGNAIELLNEAQENQFSLYLLDVIMPGMTGMEAAREIRTFDEAAEIVFLTSSPGFAYESYGVHALDYLLKPVRAEELFPLLDKLVAREQKTQEALTLKAGTTLVRIPFSRLVYVEVVGRHLFFNLEDGTVREVSGQLKEYEPILLSRPEFIHAHRSYIVNMEQIAEFSPSGIVTFSGKNLPVSRKLYPQLQANYMKLLFKQRGLNK